MSQPPDLLPAKRMGLAKRLWWSLPWRVRRGGYWMCDFYRYVGLVCRVTWRPFGGTLRNFKTDLYLVAGASIVVFIVWLAGGSRTTVSNLATTLGTGAVVLLFVLGLVLAVSFLTAPARAYFDLERKSEADLHTARGERDALQIKLNIAETGNQYRENVARRRALSLRFGTELRSILRSIEMVRAMRPNPHYSHNFQLPGARFGDHEKELTEDFPDLYVVVAKAYTAANNLNHALDFRRTQANPGQIIGVTPDDGLDAAYDAASAALTALGQSHGEVWETGAGRAARLVTEDIQRELETQDEPS